MKYGAKKTPCDHGHVHDSKLEAGRCNQLHTLQDAGELNHLEQQPTFDVVINGKKVCSYVADFAWFTGECRVVEDVKGMPTPIFNLKKKLVEAAHPGTVITVWPPRTRKKRKSAKRKAA